MQQLFGNKRYIGIGGVAFVLIALAVLGYYYLAPSSSRNQAFAVARMLGYTDDALLVDYSNCWELASQCGDRVIYTTSDPLENVQKKMAQLGWEQRFGGNNSSIFTDINMVTSHRFTANNRTNTSLAENIPAKDLPTAWAWMRTSTNGKDIYVYFYDTASHPVDYAFDDRKIINNIIEILYITR